VHRDDLGAAAAGGLAGGLLFSLAYRSMGDDAHITMAYARNLALDGQWGLIPGEMANSATSPLNVVLITLGTAITRQPAVAVGLVLVACLAAAAVWSSQLARALGISRSLPFVSVALLATSPLLVSTIGLETFLGVCLLVGLVRYGAEGRSVAAGVVAGLLVLTRPDYAVLAMVVTVVLTGLRQRLIRTTAVALAVAAPWHVFSWLVLGSAVPDTFVFKTLENNWYGATLANAAPTYAELFPAAPQFLAVLPAAVGALCLVGWGVAALIGYRTTAGSVAAAFGLAGVGHFAALAILEVPPYLWYYGPVLAGLTLCGAVTGAAAVRLTVSRTATATAAAVTASAAAVTAAAVALLVSGPVPWREPPLIGNFATAAEYAAVGRGVREVVPAGVPVSSPGEIGGIAFHCDCRILDKFSTRALTAEPIAARVADAGPVMRRLLKWNYMHLPPAGLAPVTQWRLEFRADPADRGPSDVRWWPATMSWHEPGQVVLVHNPVP